MEQTTYFPKIAKAAAVMATAFIAALPLIVWGSDKAPEFYGAFAAAIIAAASLVYAAYYQNQLTSKRNDDLRQREKISDAIDLCFWLDHTARELEFISRILAKMSTKMATGGKTHTEIPIDQFREVLSSHVFEEFLSRAKIASQLPADIAAPITRAIYRSFTISERMLLLKGASPEYQASLEEIDQYFSVVSSLHEKMRLATTIVENYLVEARAMTANSSLA